MEVEKAEKTQMEQDFAHAVEIAGLDFPEAEGILQGLIKTESGNEEDAKVREQSIYKLAELYAKHKKMESIVALLDTLKPFFASIPKARTAKIVRTLIDSVGLIPGSTDKEISLCLEWIAWTREEKRTFLRHRLESKLASLYLSTSQYRNALEILNRLLSEVKKLDDKAMLVEIQLIESRCHHSLKNLPRAKAALTSARTSANAIYVPPLLQAEIDVLAGTLHAEEKDYKTAFSYFYEGFENHSSMNSDASAVLCLKYMLMCKIMTNNAEDVAQLISGKAGLRYSGREVDAMKAVAAAYQARSLLQFEVALQEYSGELKDDPVVHSHLSGLYETLLEQNLLRIIEPYSRVQISRIAQLIKLDATHVEKKLSQMILDKKLEGILDQGSGCLIIHDHPELQTLYESTIGTMDHMGTVVDSLFKKTLKL